MVKKIQKKDVMQCLKNVIDPELDISIADLGLIYEIEFPDDQNVKVIMTLTSMGCPLFNTIHDDIHKSLKTLGYNPDTIEVELTWDPPWSESMMSELARAEIGIS
jgi:metal-sulfur cluster biosynthetic enzyme